MLRGVLYVYKVFKQPSSLYILSAICTSTSPCDVDSSTSLVATPLDFFRVIARGEPLTPP